MARLHSMQSAWSLITCTRDHLATPVSASWLISVQTPVDQHLKIVHEGGSVVHRVEAQPDGGPHTTLQLLNRLATPRTPVTKTSDKWLRRPSEPGGSLHPHDARTLLCGTCEDGVHGDAFLDSLLPSVWMMPVVQAACKGSRHCISDSSTTIEPVLDG